MKVLKYSKYEGKNGGGMPDTLKKLEKMEEFRFDGKVLKIGENTYG